MSLYDSDFHAWAREQADAVRRRSWNELDWENVAEELESLGKQQRAELTNHYRVLLAHLLKWLHQPNLRSASWRNTIEEQRIQIRRNLRDSPSLKSSLGAVYADAYELARVRAVRETGLARAVFPETPPFTLEQALNDDFWPGVEGDD